MKIAMTLVFVCAISINLTAQINNVPPCQSPEASQFDFWVGEWVLTYNDTVHAKNVISRDLDGCVIHEHFYDPSQLFKGNSWSVFDPNKKVWQQTWVDNQGGYIVLTGTFKDGKMTLVTEPRKLKDKTWQQHRMIYYNITKNSFDWNWEVTNNKGKTWLLSWKIHYDRKM